jgi:hypothetical protein
MRTRTYLRDALEAIDAAIRTATWKDGPPLPPNTDSRAKTYAGDGDGWHFLVVRYATPGGDGYDGMANKGPTIVRLTRDLAEEAFKLAEKPK